jgi:hypothetical protein
MSQKIDNEPVEVRKVSVTMDSPLGTYYTKNVTTYQGKEYDVICNGHGDCFIFVDGKKRYLEE